jgi:hypothetical protein
VTVQFGTMHSAENPQPKHHRHLKPTTGSKVVADNVLTTQRIGDLSPLDERRERKNGCEISDNSSTGDRAIQKCVARGKTSQCLKSQTSWFPSSEPPQSFSRNRSNVSFSQRQYHDHTNSLNLSNDSSLSLAVYHSSLPISAITCQNASFPATPMPEASKEASLATTNASATMPLAATTTTMASLPQSNRTDSSYSTLGKEVTTKTSPTGLVAPSLSTIQQCSPSSNIAQHHNAPILEPGTQPSAQAERNYHNNSSLPPENGSTLSGIQQMVDSVVPVAVSTSIPSSEWLVHKNSPAPLGQSNSKERNLLLMSKRDSLPLGLRNKKMQATDCLLFAATLLEGVGAAVADATHPVHDIVATDDDVSNEIKEHPSAMPSVTAPRSIAFVPPPSTAGTSSDTSSKQAIVTVSNPCPVGGDINLANGEVGGTACSRTNSPVAQTPNGSMVVTDPKVVDVLCGRGGKVNKHPGNVIFRRVVAFNKPYYQTVHKRNRILVSQSIVQAIINHGGRFLIMGQRGKKNWVPIDFKKAVQKTSQALREFKKDDDDSGNGKEKVDARELHLMTSHDFEKA